MKSLPIRVKITCWFTAALIFVVFVTYSIILFISNQVFQKTIKDNLIETVENNVDEIEFYPGIEDINFSRDADYFMKFGNGYLEIDDDFLDQVNQVYTALYDGDMTLIYGENPISRETSEAAFMDSRIQKMQIRGTVYYIFDRKLEAKGLEGLWLRGTVSERQGADQVLNITRLSRILLPALVLAASIGGYMITGKMLRPIQKISETAQQIGKENDLKKRIELGKGSDELHQLAANFNDMFQRLEEAFEIQRQFTSDASHELRTPMSVILAQCEFSLEQERTQEEYEQALEVIWRQGKKMSRLINGMLDFTRLEAGDRYGKELFDMTELVSSVCFDMALMKEKGITLKYEVEEGVQYYGNAELLSRLLMNLISNAYRYGKENGHIFVQMKTAEKAVELSVEDDGIGIRQEEQQKIFRRFYQSDRSRTAEGAGLGLSMACEIARFHGGELRVQSEPEKGSIFILFLPIL